MCAYLQISRSAYYAWLSTGNLEARKDARRELIQEAWLASRKTYGYRRIQVAIQRKHGQIINHKAVLRLMQELTIRSVARRRRPYTGGRGVDFYYPNRLKRKFSAEAPNQKWVSDITCLRTTRGFVYLSVFKDLFDGFVVGYHLARSDSTSLIIQALRKALSAQSLQGGQLILHSDQGVQYASGAYQEQLRRNGLQPSMSRKGNALDNAPAESFFSNLKQEGIQQQVFDSFEEVQTVVDDYMYFYNYERIQLKTKLTPFEVRSQFAQPA